MSSMTREDLLRELELLPTWQLREPVKVAATVANITEEVLAGHIDKADIDKAGDNKTDEFAARSELIKQMDWQNLQQCVQSCQACGLAKTRSQTVFGVGDPDADWLFVGEAPGAEEDRQGEPFVGQAGRLLDNMLAAIQLKRGQNVFIANVLKCRPPENRDPHGEEVLQCAPFLQQQVALIQPKLIVALGKFAAQSLLQSENMVAERTLASLRGQLHDYNGVPVIVTYHPAYLLRNLADKAKAWEDLCFAKKTMQGL
jgi:DNA polymerase